MRKLPIIAFIVFIIGSQSFAQKIAQWRGENRDGIYQETQLLKKWPDKGPELLWFVEGIGAGYAAPSITTDKVVINGELDSLSYLFAYDTNGKLLWKSPNGQEFMGNGFSGTYPGARSTPTIFDNLVYASSGRGRIACYDLANGKEKWNVDMVKDLGGYENEFGYSESLVVDDKNVYCFPGGPENNIAAIDRFTGNMVWSSKAMGDTTSFCSPILINLKERQILVTFSRHYLIGVDSKNGQLLWSYNIESFKWDGEHCNTPIYADGFIYNVSAEENGNGTVKLELSPDGKSIKEIWRNKQIANGFSGFVKVDNNLFMTIEKNWLKSIELGKGNVVDSLKIKNGSLIFADNKFICYSTNGEVKLIDYEQKKFEVVGKLKIEKGTSHHFAHPVLDSGIMYIRHGDALMAYKIK
ncbi:MAG: PQQ-like beta-propeller repeat protein [Salinivirgaceae bacterium]|jgi:outer membrane protein assembly factor BamB|nr:PQQ-like beta-propeller repeat protein [Salinivirgaceae bacterium]